MSALAYHRVLGKDGSDFDLPVARFREQLRFIRDQADVVRPGRRLLEAPPDACPQIPKVILTFDDAYSNFYEVVYPSLHEMKMVAVLFIPAGVIDGGVRGDGFLGSKFCSWIQIREMVDSGWVVPGSHGLSHRSFHRISSEDQIRELDASRKLIEDRIGSLVEDFAWPFGHWSRSSVDHAEGFYPRTWGFQGGVMVRGQTAPRVLPRIPVRRQDSLTWFRRKVSGSAALEDRIRSLVSNRKAARVV